ncbi:hypothetical protein IKR20_02495 [bacterium]|nr:hypothetical protein [bacterium]
MSKKLLIVFLIVFGFSELCALVEGRISGNKIPSLSTTVSIEESNFAYNAPLMKYFNLNAGLTATRLNRYGLSFGIDWQWLDGKNVAALLRVNGLFLTNHRFSKIFLGGYADVAILGGVKISGFKGIIHTSVSANPTTGKEDVLVALELQLGAYVSPNDSFNLFFGLAPGRYFVGKEYFYFNVIISMEAFLWK